MKRSRRELSFDVTFDKDIFKDMKLRFTLVLLSPETNMGVFHSQPPSDAVRKQKKIF